MEKEDIFNVYDKVFLELKNKFEPLLNVIRHEYRTNENGSASRCEGRFKLVASHKYISLWMVNSLEKNNPYSLTIAIGDNKSDYGFLLTDYLSFRNIEFDRSLIFANIVNVDSLYYLILKLIDNLRELTQYNEIDMLLNSEYKLNVPNNYFPYK
jgi:hypothetical protein